MAGVVRAHDAAKERRLKLIVGSEFRTLDDLHVVLLAPTQTAYAADLRADHSRASRGRQGHISTVAR